MSAHGRSAWIHPFTSLVLLVLASALLPGCGGCVQSEDPLAEKEAEKEKKKVKPKADFEPPQLAIAPHESATAGRLLAKPGHWTAAVERMKANNFDFVGDLDATVLDRQRRPLPIDRTPYQANFSRPAPLPKGQDKFFEFAFLVPPGHPDPRLVTDLRARGGATVMPSRTDPLWLMPAHQYYFVVLAQQPERYLRLARLPALAGPDFTAGGDAAMYRVVAPPTAPRVALPSHVLQWTSIACLLWDDFSPSSLTVEQQTALIDWLHWGGELIISGPQSLDALRGSFLARYLPATAGDVVTLAAADLAALSGSWTIRDRRGLSRDLDPVRPWNAVKLVKHPAAEFLPECGELVVERRIGRGRVLATAFRLSQRELLNWRGFDGFVNGVLLAHPARRFYEHPQDHTPRYEWPTVGLKQPAAQLATQLRWLSRDVDDSGGFAARPDQLGSLARYEFEVVDSADPALDPSFDYTGDLDDVRGAGLGGWHDFSGIANAARETVSEAAGIVIPRPDFVARVLLVYLAVLVPLNWIVFRAMGRVELAWVAAPMIALGGAAAVVKLAELDIGFARSQTEVAVVELQAGYPRAHVTRYTAFYTSLSTPYDLVFDDPGAVALPFSSDPDFSLALWQSIEPVTLHEDAATSALRGYPVPSNFTRMVHSEQMLSLGGTIDYANQGDQLAQVFNRTQYTLRNAGVVRRSELGRVEAAWIGELQPGTGRTLEFTFVAGDLQDQFRLPQWNAAARAGDDPDTPARLHVERLLGIAGASAAHGIPSSSAAGSRDRTARRGAMALAPGEVRLLATIDEPLPGMTAQPASSQSPRTIALFVAHLDYGALPARERDRNTRFDLDSLPKIDDPINAVDLPGIDDDGGDANETPHAQQPQTDPATGTP